MDKQVEKVMDACILAGKVLMENGAEMHRVEDTMNRILAVEQGSNHAVSFVMPTGIFITSAHGSTTKMKRITKRRQNMDRIGEINRLSREFAAGKYTVDELYDEIVKVENEEPDFPLWLKYISAGAVSAAMSVIFRGPLEDIFIAFVIGGIGYMLYGLLNRTLGTRFLQELIVSFLMATISNALFALGLVGNQETLIIGCIIILVPGIQIMNSIRDFLSGNTISGSIFLIEAIFVACMIGAGVMTGVRFA